LRRRVEGGQHVVRGLVGGGVRPGAARRRTEKRYGGAACVIEVTASYSAACRSAKLRVGCRVAGWAPGVPRMVISSRFQSTADCPDPRANATADRGTGPFRAVAASAGVLVPAT